MKQILQELDTGKTDLADEPTPALEKGNLLIQNCRSLVSLGTEKMLVQFGKANLLQKARAQPEKVRQVLEKIKSDGATVALQAVLRRLGEPIPLGYSSSGTVIGVGAGAEGGFRIGDRVASNGPHAEVVSVPAHLAAKVPDNVDDDAAAFAVVGAVALQGVRLAKPELGETFVVMGLGLIGQLTAQFLKAAGCRVLGFDLDPRKIEVAQQCGVMAFVAGGDSDPVRQVMAATSALGADGVIVAASTTSNEVIAQSARMSRQRGRIILTGVAGLDLNRADFYEKELTFQVSCSYGPGRYDSRYEGRGLDYPFGLVRWTENRNFQAVLESLSTGAVTVAPLITRRVPLEQFREIYEHMEDAGLASLLIYDPKHTHPARSGPGPFALTRTTLRLSDRGLSAPGLALVGSGNFAKMTVLPALGSAGISLAAIVSANGVSGTHLARKYGIPISTTDFSGVLADPQIGGVIIATRHNLHAAMAVSALTAGKHVLVEKPLCLRIEELLEISQVRTGASIAVGFNRRFSPHAVKMKELLNGLSPISVVATMNAGSMPANHWLLDSEVGGGRLLGEACHYIDFALFLAGSLIQEVCAVPLGGGGNPQTASILLRHANGSTSTVNYLANGHRDYAKERVEVFSQGKVLVLDNFRVLTGYGFRRFKRMKTRQDKGHAAQFAEFSRRVREGGEPLIPWGELVNSTLATLAVLQSIETRQWVSVETTA